MHSSATTYFLLGSGFWATTPEQDHPELLRHYSARAQELLARHLACPPDDDRLELIIRAAMEARSLHYLAVMNEPTTEDLDEYFDYFVIQSVSGIADSSEARDDN